MRSLYCSPSRVKHSKKYKSCLTYDELVQLAKHYNNIQPTHAISNHAFSSYASLYKEIGKRFSKRSKGCKQHQDFCWIDNEIVKSSNLYYDLVKNYRPKKPKEWEKNNRTWLSNLDIEKVMKQYEYRDKTFKFMGVFPVDFAHKTDENADVCVVQTMCRFDIKEILTQYTECGIIFNLDGHKQSGSHWVGMFICLNPASPKFGLCYYDSGGIPPPKTELADILKFVKLVKEQVEQHFPNDGKRFVLKFNNKRHQFKNTECGIFSMIFIILCLNHNSETYHKTRKRIKTDKNDNFIHQFRDLLYKP